MSWVFPQPLIETHFVSRSDQYLFISHLLTHRRSFMVCCRVIVFDILLHQLPVFLCVIGYRLNFTLRNCEVKLDWSYFIEQKNRYDFQTHEYQSYISCAYTLSFSVAMFISEYLHLRGNIWHMLF